jgi:hypothetical protein
MSNQHGFFFCVFEYIGEVIVIAMCELFRYITESI